MGRKRSPRSHRLGVRAALWECLDCPAGATLVFTDGGCVMVAPGAKGSFPWRTEDAMKLTSIIPLSNPQTRTTGFQGTRMCIAEPPGTKSASRLQLLYCEKNQTSLREIRKGLCLMENSQPYPLAASPLAQVLYDPHTGTSLNEVLAQKGAFPQRI